MQIISKFLIVNKNVIFGIMINYLYSRLMTSQTFFHETQTIKFRVSEPMTWLAAWKIQKIHENFQK